ERGGNWLAEHHHRSGTRAATRLSLRRSRRRRWEQHRTVAQHRRVDVARGGCRTGASRRRRHHGNYPEEARDPLTDEALAGGDAPRVVAAGIRFVSRIHASCRYPYSGTHHFYKGRIVPTGKVRFYDAGRGFGFITDDDGRDVFLHASALPNGVENPRPGTRVEFSVADGRKGPQALSVTILEL